METLKRYRLWAIVVSCCMIVLGAAMILRPDISALAVCYLTGALCIAMGVCEIARYFSIGVIGILFRFDLIVGILSTLAGVLLLAHPTGALTVLPIILGFYIIIDSVFSIQAAVELRRFGLGSWGLNAAGHRGRCARRADDPRPLRRRGGADDLHGRFPAACGRREHLHRHLPVPRV